jgi:hypothetical protein
MCKRNKNIDNALEPVSWNSEETTEMTSNNNIAVVIIVHVLLSCRSGFVSVLLWIEGNAYPTTVVPGEQLDSVW